MEQEWTNAQKLAAVVTQWARPAISQVVATRLGQLPAMKSIEQAVTGWGIVPAGYRIENDIQPLAKPIVETLMQPMVESWLRKMPDEALPELAKNILREMATRERTELMGGVVTLEQADIRELLGMVERNFDGEARSNYTVK